MTINSACANTRLRIWIPLICIILFTVIVRLRLLGIPLERDEGEYAYTAQLMLRGIPPYKGAYSMKMPGIYAVYAVILKAFGQTIPAVHAGLLITNVFTIILVFLLGKKIIGPSGGLTACAAFAMVSLSPVLQGTSANAEHFLLLPALAGILLLLSACENGRKTYLFLSGVMLGAGFIIKQHGAAFIVFGALYLFIRTVRGEKAGLFRALLRCAVFSAGISAALGAVCLILISCGVFGNFMFWTFKYAGEYVSQVPLRNGLHILGARLIPIFFSFPAFSWLAAAGAVSALWYKKVRTYGDFIILFSLFSFLSVCPGLYFRPHYFILSAPAFAILTAAGVDSIKSVFPNKRWIPVSLIIIALCDPAYARRAFFFRMTPREASRAIYGYNPFPESVEIAEYIKTHSRKNDYIAVLGSEPQIYFYSQRHSATGYIYTYPLTEPQKYALTMQKEMIKEIESKMPRFLVFINIPSSWLVRQGSNTLIFDWFAKYTRRYYNTTAVMKIPPDSPRTGHYIIIYERKTQ